MSDLVDPESGEYVGPDSPDHPPEFDPYRVPLTDAGRALVADVHAYALNAEAHLKARKRRRRPEDARVFRELVETIVSDVAYQTLRGHRSIRITRRAERLARKTRYAPAIMSKQLPPLLDLLAHMGILNQTLGQWSIFGGSQTEISARGWLRNRLAAAGLTADDFGRRDGAEVVMLKGEDRTARVEYTDTGHTELIRAQVRAINDTLRAADIEYLPTPGAPVHIDSRNREMRRVFTRSSWISGGRLFGGFWQSMSKRERRAGILIDSQPVVHLDCRSMVAAIAYARVGKELPQDDPYAVAYRGPGGKLQEVPRGIVKQLFAALLFLHQRPNTWPKNITPPEGFALPDVLAAIEAKHAPIVPLLYRGIGHQMQHDESEVLVSALQALSEAGIPALPLHDCVVVAEGSEGAAREAMQLAFEDRLHAPVHIITELHD